MQPPVHEHPDRALAPTHHLGHLTHIHARHDPQQDGVSLIVG